MVATILTSRLPILLGLNLSILLPGLYLAGALLVGAGVIALIRRWFQGDEAQGSDASEQLARYRTLYEQGVLSEEEYRRLRAVLGVELRQAVNLPPRPAPPGPAASDAGPPGQHSETNGDGQPASPDGLRPA